MATRGDTGKSQGNRAYYTHRSEREEAGPTGPHGEASVAVRRQEWQEREESPSHRLCRSFCGKGKAGQGK